MSICSHPEALEIFITANIIWIILGWIVKGAVCNSTEQLKEAEGRFSAAICRCCFKLGSCTAELSPLPVLAQVEITQLYFSPLSTAEHRSLLL